ncbi:MAG: hypothetical protein LW852_02875 [Sediminibacterium sp.]|nr:hypothetical protein [Sediminibacterium sp.]
MNKIIFSITALLPLFGVINILAETKSLETESTCSFSDETNFKSGYSIPIWVFQLIPYKSELSDFSPYKKEYKLNRTGIVIDHNYYLKERNGLFIGPILIYFKKELESSYRENRTKIELVTEFRTGNRNTPIQKQQNSLNVRKLSPILAA